MPSQVSRKSALGPLDKRKVVRRCESCAARRIKCESGFPCKHCVKTKRICVPPKKVTATTVVFVDSSNASKRSKAVTAPSAAPAPAPASAPLNATILQDPATRYIDNFLLFMQQNQFTPRFQINVRFLEPSKSNQTQTSSILNLIRTSPLLHNTAVAIGALDASRHGFVNIQMRSKACQSIAFNSYRTALQDLQSSLSEQHAAQRDDVLWGTFFLGLFELLSDPSGDGWIRHMLYGTSMMLRLSGPHRNMSPLRRSFFSVFCILEASRTLLYGEPTMLAQDEWMEFHAQLLASEESEGIWDPLEEILALMIRCAMFSVRLGEQYSNPDLVNISKFGIEGLNLQTEIFAWYTTVLQRPLSAKQDANILLAQAYYHALMIFLSGNFDHSPYWQHMKDTAPMLSQFEVRGHVRAILDLCEQILSSKNNQNIKSTHIAGILLFFPLRVASSRARTAEQRLRILDLLDGVFRRGFVVAGRVRDDLRAVWVERPLGSIP